MSPTQIVALNRAVAIAEIDGPRTGLTELERLDLDHYHLFHATRAEMLHRLGEVELARSAYDAAIALTDNPAERRHLEGRRDHR